MLVGPNFVVTHPDGGSEVYANVRNGAGFSQCMAKLGKRVRAATDADLDASGIAAAMDRLRQEAPAPAPYGGFIIAKLPAGAKLQ